MNRFIFKYALAVDDVQAVALPAGAQILSCGVQGETICLWALVDPAAPKERRRIRVAGTGHPITEGWAAAAFVGTVLYPHGLVFHIFDGGVV